MSSGGVRGGRWQGLVAACAYFAAVHASLATQSLGVTRASVWVGSGVSVAAYFALGPRIWPWMFGSCLTVALSLGMLSSHPIYGLGIAMAYTAQGTLAAWLLRRLGCRRRLARLRDVRLLAGVACVVAPLPPALFYAAYYYLVVRTGVESTAALQLRMPPTLPLDASSVFTLRALAEVVSIISVAPLALWGTRRSFWPRHPRGWLQLLLHVGGVAAMAGAIFLQPAAAATWTYLAAPYSLFPAIMLVAARGGRRDALLSSAAAATLAFAATGEGRGPFNRATPGMDLVGVALFMAVLSLTALAFAALLHALRRQAGALRRQQASLTMLDEVGGLAASSLDERAVLDRLATRIGAHFAGWCEISYSGGAGLRPTVHTARSPRPHAPQLQRMWRRFRRGARALNAAGRPLPPPPRAGGARFVCVPLKRAGDAAGTMVVMGARRRLRTADYLLAVAVAERCAAAIDNMALYAAARSATQARDDMLAVVCHDLRDPIGSIALSAEHLAELLATPTGAAQAARVLQRISRAARRTAVLLDDLLDATCIEAGTLTVAPQPFAAAALVAEAVELLAPLAQQRRQRICCELPPEPADPLLGALGDAGRLGQVLGNLLGNASKFTPEGGTITVRVTLTATTVRIAVVDSGPGIAPTALPHICERFWQANPRGRDGAGLGLAIASGILGAHGTGLVVDSTPGRGASFAFVLPRATLGAAPDAGAAAG